MLPANNLTTKNTLIQQAFACKWWIALFTILGTALTYFALSFNVPAYRISVITEPPPVAQLAGYNRAIATLHQELPVQNGKSNTRAYNQTNGESQTLDTTQAYDIFLRHLTSARLFESFTDQVYLNNSSGNKPYTSREQARKDLQKNLTIDIKEDNGNYSSIITLKGTDKEKLKDEIKQFLRMALRESSLEAENIVTQTLINKKSYIQKLIEKTQDLQNERNKQRTELLRDAIKIAKSIQLETPDTKKALLTNYHGDQLYLRGYKSLESELAIITARQEHSAYSPELIDLHSTLALLESVDPQIEPIMAKFDLDTPTVGVSYWSTSLSLLLAFICSLIIATGLSLTPLAMRIKRGKQNKKQTKENF